MSNEPASFSRKHIVGTISVTNYEEISIHKDDWDKICDKIELLKFNSVLDFNLTLIGILLAAVIQWLIFLIYEIEYNLINIAIPSGLYVAYKFLCCVWPHIFEPHDNNKENILHVEDLKKWIKKYNDRYINHIKAQEKSEQDQQ